MFVHDAIGLNIFVIDKYFKIYLKKSLKDYNLNTAEGLVLLVLYKQNENIKEKYVSKIPRDIIGKTQDEIIYELHYDKGVITRTMQSLENKKYVKRKNNPEDSRSYIFELTEDAINLKPTLLDILNQWNNILLNNIDDEMVSIVKSQLSKMFENIIESNKNLKYLEENYD